VLTRVVRLAALGCVLAAPASVVAQNIHSNTPPAVQAVLVREGIHLDGTLDEAVWLSAPAATDFRQSQPNEGQPATQRTEVRFAYDDAAIYVGARMYDSLGGRGVRTRLVRRDADQASDYLEIIFDTYHDHIGRLFFQVNPSGAIWDANGLGGGGDQSWDPVWQVKTTIDSLGWTAEMRIPFSQMRFPSTAEQQTWGLQIWRQENRINELSQWAFWGRQESGGPPQFGHLTGIVVRGAPGRAELIPYAVARSANVPGDTRDPFYDPHALDGRFGADATVRVTSNLTLNATVNPDFGQVEVDPAVVNLSAFETSFEERRPFFVEGAGYFGLGGLSCFFCSNVSSLSMLSTRRIGRPPQISPRRADTVSFADMPENSTILGAGKLTGRTRSGWSIGALDAVTRQETAPVQFDDGSRGSFAVEPFTNYFAGRLAKDLRGGATQLRLMATSVYRDLGDPYIASRLTRRAEAVGVATDTWWHKRDYHLMAQLAGTNVMGTEAAINRVRTSSAHFFQRPDRSDTADARAAREAMQGVGGYARLSRESGKVLWEVATNFRSPAFNNNDITFFSRADYWWMGGNIFRQWTSPSTWYRQAFVIGGAQQQYNFDGDLNDRQFHAYGEIQTLGYWWINTFWIHRPNLFDDRLTRGGPVVRRPGINYWALNVSSDSRKNVVANVGSDLGCNREGDCDHSHYLNLQLKPRSNVSVSLGPSWSHSEVGFQFVGSFPDTTNTAFFGRRYLFAGLSQNSLQMDTRVSVTFSPQLTFELYVQPFVAAGAYARYNEFAAPRSQQRLVYGQDFGSITVRRRLPPPGGPAPPDSITLDPDGSGPNPGFTIDDPSFTFRSLRGNAVLRWEYRPGSTLFVVWTRNGSSSLNRGAVNFGEDVPALFQGQSENVFLVKLSFWLGM
jgi:hypothetical protein